MDLGSGKFPVVKGNSVGVQLHRVRVSFGSFVAVLVAVRTLRVSRRGCSHVHRNSREQRDPRQGPSEVKSGHVGHHLENLVVFAAVVRLQADVHQGYVSPATLTCSESFWIQFGDL